MNRDFIKHGLILILLSLITGLVVQAIEIPRLGLSAHTIAILSGVLLIAIGGVWQVFELTERQQKFMYFSWLYSSYANWFGCLLAGIFGAGKVTPLAASGKTGSPIIEALVAILLASVAVVSFVAVALSLYGLKPKKSCIAY